MNIANTFGLKGKAASGWLAAQGLTVPEQPNRWLPLADDSRILRLGRGEYLVEGNAAQELEARWQDGLPDLYRVPRYDASFELAGEKARGVLREICSLDTRPEVLKDTVVMTLAAGISVTLICAGETWRLWCDATYGEYMQHTLQQILD